MEIASQLAKADYLSFSTICSVLTGLITGVISSIIVNAVLLEISFNAFYSVFYAMFFIIIGSALIYRSNQTNPNNSIDFSQDFKARQPIIKGFGILVIVSGVSCIIIDKSFFATLNPFIKTPLYLIIGSCTCFATMFVIIDMINYVGGSLRREQLRSLIHSQSQIISITIVSMIMGAIYGLIFGWMDIEDAEKSQIGAQIMQEEYYCMIIGILLGSFGGILNQVISQKVMNPSHFQKLENDPFGQEI